MSAINDHDNGTSCNVYILFQQWYVLKSIHRFRESSCFTRLPLCNHAPLNLLFLRRGRIFVRIQFNSLVKKEERSLLRTYIYTHTHTHCTHTHVNVTRARRGEGRASTFIYIRGIYHGGKEEENCSFKTGSTPGIITRNGKEEDDSRDDDDDDGG